uniref:Predicted gene 1043 n=1 Tax=Peromyscus maniculatus bairdii TaxID=230844 RepID=A0A8C8TSK5_PERMB
MEPTAQEQTEKHFSYVIRAPSSDGFDVMNVDVKIDTCWVFRDVEESDDNEQGCLPEAASRPDLDTGLLREQLESSERKLLAAVDKHVMSESGLRSRVQELEQSERKLLLKVEQLSACVAQERRASLYAQEQLRALQGELVSQVREAESAARQQRRLQERLRHKDEALARQAAALERCGWAQQLQLGLVREQERVLRAQVQRLERDVRRLGRAAGLLLAQLHAPDPLPSAGSPQPQILAGPLGVPEATELSALRARAERAEREWAEAARRLREHSATERQLREQLEELRCCVYGLTLSEIGLQSQVEELAQQNRRLRAKLGCGSLGALGCAQSDSLPSPRAKVLDPCSIQGCHSDACGLQTPAGQLSEEPHSCIGDRPAPCLVVPARTTDKLQGDLPGSERRQGALVQPRLDGQTLGLLCSCLPAPGMDEPLCSLEPAGVSESLRAAGAQEPLLLLPTSTLPLWGPAGEPQLLLSLLLPDDLLQELQTQEELDSKPSPAPGAVAPPGWPCDLARSHVTSLIRESPLISNSPFPTKGSKEPRGMWEESSGPPVASAEKWEVTGTLGMIKSELEVKALLDQESSGKLILDTEVQAPEGMQEGSRASETQPVAHCPRLRPECLIPTLHGTTSRPQEGPDSLRKRGSVEGCSWELLGKLLSEKEEEATSSRAHETREPEPNGSQLPSGNGKEVQRRAQGKQDHQLCLEDIHLQKGRSGDEDQEEKMQLPGAPSPTSLGVPEQPDVMAHVGQEQRLPMGDQDWLLFPKWAPAGASSEGPCPSQALVTGQDRCTLQIDTLEREREACFQPLNNLKLVCGDPQQMSALMKESQSVTHTWLDVEGDVCLQQASGSQDLNAKSSRNGEGGRREEDVALCTGDVPPGAALDGEKANWGPAELGGIPLPTTWYTLKRAGSRSHQLLATPKEERSQVLLDHARLRGAQEGCHHEGCHCEEELAREAAKALRLEQANHTLQGELVHLRRELDQCLQAVSDLEDCNGKSYCKISQLEEENEKLKGDLGRLHKAMSQSVRKAGSKMKDATQENRELRALISELGVSYKGLIKDTVLGIEDMVWALQGENKHLVGRVQGLEREVLQRSRDPGEEKRCSQGNSKMAGDKGHTEDKEVQVTPFSGQLITRACGPPWDEKLGVTWGQAGPSLDLEDTRCRALASSTPSVCAVTSGPQEAHTNGTRGDGARLQKEQETPRCSMQPGQSQGSLSRSLQLQTSKTDAPEEDPKLCVQRLHHQVRTLQCQLRDQGWALRELQAARDEAVSLQEKLQGKLEELREQQREARLATSPLKAKLASLVHKCQERNRLIEQLLRELPRQEPKNHLLCELAQNMLDDVALAEYTATFLTPGAPETVCHLDRGSKGMTAGGAQEYLLNSETDSILQSLWGMESWSLPEAEWASQTVPLSSPKERRQRHQAHHTGKDEWLSQMTSGTEVAL